MKGGFKILFIAALLLWGCGRQMSEIKGLSESTPIVIEAEGMDLGTNVFGDRADLNFGGEIVNVQRAHFLNEEVVKRIITDALCNTVVRCDDGSCDCLLENIRLEVKHWSYAHWHEDTGNPMTPPTKIWYVASNTYEVSVDILSECYYVKIVDKRTKLTIEQITNFTEVLPLVNYDM